MLLLICRMIAPSYSSRIILRRTHGIIFLGTPHSGSGFAQWAEGLAKLIGLIKQTNSQIIQVLRADSEVLERIQIDFHSMLRARVNDGAHPIAITCFYEELPLPGMDEIVPKRAATLPGYTSIGIHSNHMDMTRFETEDDPGFVSIVGELRRWIKELAPGPVAAERIVIREQGVSRNGDGENRDLGRYTKIIRSNLVYGGNQVVYGGMRFG
ncbi:SesB-related regulatory protein [Rasamsonia emersonii CBS 393.64]|uniref:SesB-related regulatory protein n=1 Tax=Rasamsonia emersonii (strain ATCC 16479 / CBS 393.64 / IMI 116815) TaxID=1408163 RepID=A0A0F4YE15_RASE3|nr:SesB-related regulatory protein [Rasamsonia emersonii CBS 393.64]KKA16380.1 SesB-related regulatory protein [Rasamsonia emersonii CBS 393.64]